MDNIDHKELGKQLDLFHLEGANPGVIFWHPKGATLYNLIVDDLKKELAKRDYKIVKTPNILALETFKKSGHYDNYQDKMFFTGNKAQIDNRETRWSLTPMNCPGTLSIYRSKLRSYKEFPLRLAEMGSVYRYEQAGEVNGLFRAREFTVDDAHTFVLPDQVINEVTDLITFVIEYHEKFGFKIDHIELSTRPEKSIGTDDQWNQAESALKEALEKTKIKYKINPGDGAFYAPKIDFHVKDNHGRTWQLGTIQVDLCMPDRLECSYIDENGDKKAPIMIHRAILGSLERFIGILLEQNSGTLPAWLTPVQLAILPVSEDHMDYAQKLAGELNEYRTEVDTRNESIGRKIRDAELQKIPYILVVGEKEEKDQTVSLRTHGSKELKSLTLADLKKHLSNQ